MFDPSCPFAPGRTIWSASHPTPSQVIGTIAAVDAAGDILVTRAAAFVPVEEAVPLPDIGELVSTPSGPAWFLSWSETNRADGWLTAWVAAPSWSHATQISRPAPSWDARRCVLTDTPEPAPFELVRLLGVTLRALKNAQNLLLASQPSVPAPAGTGGPEHVAAAREES